MKRSLEETESQNSDNGDLDTSSEVSEEVFENDFTPDRIEKQIIQRTLALIRRSNMSDWDPLNATDCDCDYMPLAGKAVVYDHLLDVDQMIDLAVQVNYEDSYTYCEIIYNLGGEKRLDLLWETDTLGSDFLSVVKLEDEGFLWRRRKVEKEFRILAKDESELNWCFFQDARVHLKRILLNKRTVTQNLF